MLIHAGIQDYRTTGASHPGCASQRKGYEKPTHSSGQPLPVG